jgi:5-methylcytosine-specific restriction endonuclease McrA
MQDCLVLDSNWMPQAFCSWENAIKLVYEDRATVIKEDEGGKVLRSPSLTMGLPRIIVVKNAWTKRKRLSVPCTRRNLLIRDHATCQYCGKGVSTSDYTIDHVIPRCQGGKTVWDNVVVSCQRCNFPKAGRTPAQAHMTLINKPYVPKPHDPRYNFKLHIKKLRPEWSEYSQWLYAEEASWLYYNVELEA